MKYFFSIGIFFLVGCTTVIRPPQNVEQPTKVAIIDHGRHSTLIIESDDNHMIRYAYGDWRFYAEADEGVYQAIAALFWPSVAGLGRKELLGSVEERNIHSSLRELAEQILIFHVENEKVRALRMELDGNFRKTITTRIYNQDYDLEFVHDQRKYWLFTNSNLVLGEWLEKLGCELDGSAFFSSWKIENQ